MNEKELRLKIYREALEWRDTPWIHHQHTKGRGCDCIGLIVGVGNSVANMNFNWKDPKNREFKGYNRIPEPAKMKKGMMVNLDMIGNKWEDAKLGDVLWVRIDKNPAHVAIVGPKGLIIHADQMPKKGFPNGKVVERKFKNAEKQKIIGVFRYKSVSELM